VGVQSRLYRFPHGNRYSSRQTDVAAKQREPVEDHAFKLAPPASKSLFFNAVISKVSALYAEDMEERLRLYFAGAEFKMPDLIISAACVGWFSAKTLWNRGRVISKVGYEFRFYFLCRAVLQ
jgi:hypothetical protein